MPFANMMAEFSNSPTGGTVTCRDEPFNDCEEFVMPEAVNKCHAGSVVDPDPYWE